MARTHSGCHPRFAFPVSIPVLPTSVKRRGKHFTASDRSRLGFGASRKFDITSAVHDIYHMEKTLSLRDFLYWLLKIEHIRDLPQFSKFGYETKSVSLPTDLADALVLMEYLYRPNPGQLAARDDFAGQIAYVTHKLLRDILDSVRETALQFELQKKYNLREFVTNVYKNYPHDEGKSQLRYRWATWNPWMISSDTRVVQEAIRYFKTMSMRDDSIRDLEIAIILDELHGVKGNIWPQDICDTFVCRFPALRKG